MTPSRILITGANGSGKTHLAVRIAKENAHLPYMSFDAVKLTTQWQTRSTSQINTHLAAIIRKPAWILEGGPSMLERALPYAQGVIWLDTPTYRRAYRLTRRAFKYIGKSRPELPTGNIEYPLQQLKFAWNSLRKSALTTHYLEATLLSHKSCPVFRCITNLDVQNTLHQLNLRR